MGYIVPWTRASTVAFLELSTTTSCEFYRWSIHLIWNLTSEKQSALHQSVHIKQKQSLQCIRTYISSRNRVYKAYIKRKQESIMHILSRNRAYKYNASFFISIRSILYASESIYQAETESTLHRKYIYQAETECTTHSRAYKSSRNRVSEASRCINISSRN